MKGTAGILITGKMKRTYGKIAARLCALALGGAMLAAVANGEFASVEDAAAKIVRIIDTVEPDPELVEKYEARYQQFKQIYPACKELFPKLQ